VKRDPETNAAGVAGLTGRVVGRTTPSTSGMPVIGTAADDVALAVKFDEPRDSLWFSPELLEALDDDRAAATCARTPGRKRRRGSVPKLPRTGGAPNWFREVLDSIWPPR
jgi:hypothetical protein